MHTLASYRVDRLAHTFRRGSWNIGYRPNLVNMFFELCPTLLPSLSLFALFIFIMLLTDVLNNAAAAIIMAPISVNMTHQPFRETRSFFDGCRCWRFMRILNTHWTSNNILVMGPGGYSFRGFWRVGLPLEILIALVAVPLILFVWPF